MTETTVLPQPYEGIVGTLRDQDDLISLDEKAIPRRKAMMVLAWHLHGATSVYGNKTGNRLRKPQPNDLVFEPCGLIENRQERELFAFGYLIYRRQEWTETNEEYEELLTKHEFMREQPRGQDEAWYIQYGPLPEDICRWQNCSFITIPTDLNFNRA